jgi:hypothetical protein
MRKASRTTNLAYEEITGYPSPEALPPLDKWESYVRTYADRTHLPQNIARWILRGSGLKRRWEQFQRDPALYERALRDVPSRFMVSNAIMFSATAVLRDEEPAPEPLDRAARLLVAARSFYRDLLKAKLPADTFRGAPMEMGQYRNLFSTCNYPSGTCLEIYKSPEDSYIIVAVRGSFYRLSLPEADAPFDASTVRAWLETIVTDARRRGRAVSPGVLSSAGPLHRTVGFTLLRLRKQNRISLDVLANAFLVLCLDLEDKPSTEEDACRLAQSRNRDNRWYLASNQIVVFQNGKASITFSYICGIDGNVMTRFASEVRRRALDIPVPATKKADPFPSIPEPLQFSVPAWLAHWADSSCRSLLSDEHVLYRVCNWGGEDLLRRGLRLDSVFNLAMMMAEERLIGHPPVHVELLSMAKYRYCGLGDAVPYSPAVSRLADPAFDVERGREAADTLREALDAHLQSIRIGRERLHLGDFLSMHMALSSPWEWPPIVAVLMKYMSSTDVIVSFPHPSPDVTVVGRIGVRLLTRLFSLHYETSAEAISVAFMPAMTKGVPIEQAFVAFEESLKKVVRIARLIPEGDNQPWIRTAPAMPALAGERPSDAMPS